MTVTVTPMENGFGTETAEMDPSRPISGEDRVAVYGAFLDHHLIIIRGQALNAEQVTAACILGDELESAKPRTLWRATTTSGGLVF